ncbi:AhpC/TSA [mine drainage metagenome]|jgi:peroxiredoxin|uniref:AhpC/TSA n=1 Tax=mine drainage metagenome TaxID=410659 RepID=T0YF92_9ZZZZ
MAVPVNASPGGKMAPDISLHDMNGRVWTLSALRGKWVLLNFWATWCGPCLKEMPDLERFSHSPAARRMIILAVSESLASHKKIVSFLKKNQITYTVLNDPFGEVADAYHVRGLPTTALIAPNGHLLWEMEGAINFTSPDFTKVYLPKEYLSGVSR